MSNNCSVVSQLTCVYTFARLGFLNSIICQKFTKPIHYFAEKVLLLISHFIILILTGFGFHLYVLFCVKFLQLFRFYTSLASNYSAMIIHKASKSRKKYFECNNILLPKYWLNIKIYVRLA